MTVTVKQYREEAIDLRTHVYETGQMKDEY